MSITQSLTQRLKSVPRPLLIVGGTALILLLAFALKPRAKVNPAADLVPFVSTLSAQPQPLRPTVTLYGRVETPRESTLSSTVNGFVKNLQVQEGHAVAQDQMLVELDTSDVALILAQREAEVADMDAQLASEIQRHQNDLKSLEVERKLLELANTAAARYEKLVSKNVGSDLSRDEALQAAKRQALNVLTRELAVQDHPNRRQRLQAQLEKARALRDQARLDLQRSTITAPFAGRVTRLNVSPGNRLRPGDPVLTLFDHTHLEVRAQIPTRYLGHVQSALREGVVMDALFASDGHKIPLRLDRLAGAISLGQGGVDGLFTLDNPDDQLTLGRAGELYLHLPPEPDLVAVPPSAIYGQQRIYEVRDGLLHTIAIRRAGEILLDSGEQWQLVAGDIKPGALILTTQLSNAVGGTAVRLAPAAQPVAIESPTAASAEAVAAEAKP